ncbi:MAG: hypothetical protein LBR52_05890 [Prevotellaceae bacterium]|jgi:hypothetical protein|nr:hypothetical protein [Prevotellaceae bacterium]
MKTRIIRTKLLAWILFALTPIAQAQVTVGLDENPVAGAILQLKEKASVTDSAQNAYRGFALPRVVLIDKHELYPMFLADPTDPSSTPSADYTSNKATIKKAHTGLTVYNLIENDNLDLCKGLNLWDGTQWICFQPRTNIAKFNTVSCAGIVPNGTYTAGTPTNASNYLQLTLTVAKVGAYTISATTGNGYNFYLSGIASNTGTMTVNLPCQGTPVNAGTNTLTFSGITLATGCTPTVTVAPAVATYSIDCSTLTVNGTYLKGTALTSSNTIQLNVVTTAPGSYSISTPVTNGISFSAAGNFSTSGTQQITLAGTGIPTVNMSFSVTVNANTQQGNNSCTATIPVTLPVLTYAVIGVSDYSWSPSAARGAAIANTANFGPYGKLKIQGLNLMWSTNSETTAAGYLNNGYTGAGVTGGGTYTNAQPDVVLFCNYADGGTDTNLAPALGNYSNKGGCIIYSVPDGNATQVNAILNAVFGTTGNAAQPQIAGSGTTDDNDYQIANLSNDPIINGFFGNLGSKYWGEDNGSTGSIIVTAMPSNSVQICSAYNPFGKTSVNPAYSIVWYNPAKGFVYFGDSTGSSTSDQTTDVYPSLFINNVPQSKYYGNYPHSSATMASQIVYNSYLEFNALAWALRKAAISGINPH